MSLKLMVLRFSRVDPPMPRPITVPTTVVVVVLLSVLEQIFSNDSDCDEDADEEASEEEDGEEYNPEDEETTEDDDDDDYDAAAAAADDEDDVQTFVSRNGQIQWCSVPCDNNRGVGGAAAAAKSNRPVAEVPEDMRPGPTRQAVGQARDILSTFRLFFTPEIEDIILEMTNLEGHRTTQHRPKHPTPHNPVRGRGVRSAPQRRTVKHTRCAPGVTNTSAKAVRTHTVPHVPTGPLPAAPEQQLS
ncbi:unnamed protein product, partial [Coregonus sp. 'balchen']